MKEGRPQRADQLLSRLLAGDGAGDPSVLHYAGVARYRCGRFDEAEALLRQATEAAPTYAEAHNSLGTLLLETGRTRRGPRRAGARRGAAPRLRQRPHQSRQRLERRRRGRGGALAYRRAISLDPYDPQAHHRLARTRLALGDVQQALAACAAALTIDPFCQNALATRALAEQTGGDAEAGRRLYDFERFVTRISLAPPPGSGDIEAFNKALAAAVREAPTLVWEPLNRVTRDGAVTEDMLAAPSRTIRSLERALRVAIDGYRETLVPERESPFLARIPRRYRLTLIASILTAGGRHPPHVHEGAWLSGVYYVAVPLADDGRLGRLARIRPARPRPARRQRFPVRQPPAARRHGGSSPLNGTVPFEGPGERRPSTPIPKPEPTATAAACKARAAVAGIVFKWVPARQAAWRGRGGRAPAKGERMDGRDHERAQSGRRPRVLAT